MDGVTALTSTEISAFSVSGSYSATVNVDSTTYASQNRIVITASGLPDHAWQMVNPNTPSNQNHEINVLNTPEDQSSYGCLPMGKIGISKTGVAIFNPLTAENYNAVEGGNAETFDTCDGHATNTGEYHYHKIPGCIYNKGVDEFIGVALDGYPIYGPLASWHNSGNTNLTTSDLDKCHGSDASGSYRYYMTYDWPYILGCFKGKVIDRRSSRSVSYTCSNSSTSSFDSSWGFLCSCTNSRAAATVLRSRFGVMLTSILVMVYGI
ncbi:uncharacterized protein LOC134281839 [Saccostrea cucullata]|uniref:uncharacterized protein LOC134281839 n=1 Tax=Saccostrea cuccullata TaxID=36930 RepID=UPI002ED45495